MKTQRAFWIATPAGGIEYRLTPTPFGGLGRLSEDEVYLKALGFPIDDYRKAGVKLEISGTRKAKQ